MTMMIEKSKIFEENILEITAVSIICYTAFHVLKQISDLTVGFCAIGPFRLCTVHENTAQTACPGELDISYLEICRSRSADISYLETVDLDQLTSDKAISPGSALFSLQPQNPQV